MSGGNVYKIGIIGAGEIVETAHLPVLKVLDKAEVIWIFDKNEARCDLISRMFKVPVIKEEELARSIAAIDICLLSIPYGARAAYFQICAENEIAVYAEKPFATTIEEHKKLCSMFPPHKLAVGFQRRTYSIVHLLKHLIRDEIFGKLEEITFIEGYFNLKSGKEYLSNSSLSGGGVIIESAIHALDQILQITEADNVVLNSVKSLHLNGIDYDSEFRSIIKREKGDIPINCKISSIRNLDNSLEVRFEDAVVRCSLSSDAVVKVYPNKDSNDCYRFEVNNADKKQFAFSVNHSFFIFWNEFISALEKKKENSTSACTSLLTTHWIDQLYFEIKS